MVILEKRVVGLSVGSLDRFLLRARHSVGLRGTVNVLITSSSIMRALNLRFRGHNQATDVLSFPAEQSSGKNGARSFAGELAISADIAAQNAVRLGHSAFTEVKILALHGILHLAGLDHERDNGEMARKEANLRRVLKLPSTLIERVHSGAKKTSAKPLAKTRSRKSRRTA